MKEDLWNIFKIALLSAIVLLLASCKTIERAKYMPVENIRTEYSNHLVVAHDSVHVHDSISVMFIGDTLYKYKQQIISKNRFVHDTIYISHTDSIPIIVPAERQLNKWQQFKLYYLGYITVLLLLVLLVLIFLKLKA